MEVVNLLGLHRITDIGMKSLARCVRLKTVIIKDCYKLTDDSIITLAKNRCLEKLDASSVDLVTDKSISALRCMVPRLKNAFFSQSHVSEGAVCRLAEDLNYCMKVQGKLALCPLHKCPKTRKQHNEVSFNAVRFPKKYISVLNTLTACANLL